MREGEARKLNVESDHNMGEYESTSIYQLTTMLIAKSSANHNFFCLILIQLFDVE